jgi:hypothetical protein
VWAVEFQAVPPLGDPDNDDLDARAGLALGNYRFHVVGDGWTLDSAPFEVVPGGVAIAASRNGMLLTATVTLSAPRGFRLLDLTADSNRGVPLRSQSVTVELLDGGGGTLHSGPATTNDGGTLTLDDADVATATTVRITDVFGNSATQSL